MQAGSGITQGAGENAAVPTPLFHDVVVRGARKRRPLFVIQAPEPLDLPSRSAGSASRRQAAVDQVCDQLPEGLTAQARASRLLTALSGEPPASESRTTGFTLSGAASPCLPRRTPAGPQDDGDFLDVQSRDGKRGSLTFRQTETFSIRLSNFQI